MRDYVRHTSVETSVRSSGVRSPGREVADRTVCVPAQVSRPTVWPTGKTGKAGRQPGSGAGLESARNVTLTQRTSEQHYVIYPNIIQMLSWAT